MGSALLAGTMAALPTSGAAESHKVEVHDAAAARSMAAQGGRLIADYGGFQLYEVSGQPANLPDSAEVRDAYNSIMLNAAQLDTTKPEVQALRKQVSSFTGKRMHLVHFSGPVQPAWRAALLDAGVQIVSYIPYNAYLVYGDTAGIGRVQAMAAAAPHVQWDGAYLDGYKIHPNARTADQAGNPRQIRTDRFAIQLVADAEVNAATLKLIDQLKLAPVERQRPILNVVDVIVRLAAADLPKLAARPDVISIQSYGLPKKVCERQDQIVAGHISGNAPSGPGYLAWLENLGFNETQFTNFVVDVSDSGIDNGTTAPNHFGLYVGGNTGGASRVAYNILEGYSNPGSTLAGCDGHGNLNAHIVMGYDNGAGFPFADGLGYHYGLGVCPFAKVGSSVIFDPTNSTGFDDTTVISTAYANGARISNNSWGDSDPEDDGSYDVDSFEYDALTRDAEPTGAAYSANGNQEMVIVFAAGNDGPDKISVSPPGTAKNVITVGAAQNVQPFGGEDGSGIGDSGADNANAIIFFSSRGPCSDGRLKPDLVAPGTHVSGGVPQNPNPAFDGTALDCFINANFWTNGISGSIDGSPFFPSGQQFYTASSGTSHATPCVTGGCALVRQYFLNNSNPAPSPAMTKAFLMNSARYMTGSGANDTLWSDSQGMGEMDLGMAFDGTARVLYDEPPGNILTASGQTRVFSGMVSDTTKPFRVTVAWTDAPGSTTGDAYNNDLDLSVAVGGRTYKGNVFSRSNSVTGGAADTRNNVESVFLPAGTSGRFTVTITAANINSAGVPDGLNGSGELSQDFALVIYNAEPAAAMAAAGCTLTNATCVNGAVNPGEQVTLNLAVRNVGGAAATNLVGTLVSYLADQNEAAPGVAASSNTLAAQLEGNAVALPGGPQTYGALAAGASASMPFTFTADGSCGQTITVALQLQDGANDLGTVSYNIPLGQLLDPTSFTQDFDTNTPGSLPAGWTSLESSMDFVGWAIEDTNAVSSPDAVSCPDAGDQGEVILFSPTIALSSGTNQLSFQNEFNLEYEYDGGVLEIAIGNAAIANSAFTDILSAGGSFVSGGYNDTLTEEGDPQSAMNPLHGRSAWTGTSDGFETTVVNLPASASGTNIQLRWICGTDFTNLNLVGVGGWWIDNVTISQPHFDCSSCPASNVAFTSIVFPANGSLFTNTSPLVAVTGQAPDNSIITISNNGAAIATASSDGNGIYSALATLNFGANILTATQGATNSSGNVMVVVALAPPAIQWLGLADTNFAVSGTGAPGGTVYLYEGTSATGSPLQTFSIDNSGNFSGTAALPLGNYMLTATESANGAVSASTTPASISIVSQLPPIILSPTNGSVINQPTELVSGTGTVGATVIIYDVTAGGTNTLTHAIVNRAGKFSATVKMADGANVLYAVQTPNGTNSPDSAFVQVMDYLSPEILVWPGNQTNFLKGTVTFPAQVAGAAPLKIYWEKNGGVIPGAASDSLTLSNLKTNNAGSYNLFASNAYGTASSAAATLTLVANPFTNLTGTYAGLFAESNAQFSSSGFLTLNLTTLGSFSAQILNAGGSYSFSGGLDGNGLGSCTVSRGTGTTPLTMALDLNVTNGSNQILGTVSAGTNWTAALETDLSTFSAKNPCPNSGKFTLVFAGTNNGTQSPGGNGYGTVSVNASGLASLSGILSDNTSVAPSAASVSTSGRWPLYIPLYGKSGSLGGWIEFTNQGSSLTNLANAASVNLAGSNIMWFRTNASGKLYTNGFTNVLTAVGSVFSPTNNTGLLGQPSLEVTLSGGDLIEALSSSVKPSASGKFTVNGNEIPGLKLNLNPASGVFSGSFQSAGKTLSIKGVILQDQTNAGGFFLGPEGSGSFLLTPP